MTPTQKAVISRTIGGDLDSAARIARGAHALKRIPAPVKRRLGYQGEQDADIELAERSDVAARFGGSVVAGERPGLIVYSWPGHERAHHADDTTAGIIAARAMMEDAGVVFPLVVIAP